MKTRPPLLARRRDRDEHPDITFVPSPKEAAAGQLFVTEPFSTQVTDSHTAEMGIVVANKKSARSRPCALCQARQACRVTRPWWKALPR
jgi:hypothetical protein